MRFLRFFYLFLKTDNKLRYFYTFGHFWITLAFLSVYPASVFDYNDCLRYTNRITNTFQTTRLQHRLFSSFYYYYKRNLLHSVSGYKTGSLHILCVVYINIQKSFEKKKIKIYRYVSVET